MRILRHNSVINKILIPTNLIAGVLMLGLAGWMLSRQVVSNRQEIASKVATMQDFLSKASVSYVINFDLGALDQFAQQTVKDKDFVSVTFLDLQNKPLAQAAVSNQTQVVTTESDIVDPDGTKLATLRLGYSKARALSSIHSNTIAALAAVVVSQALLAIGVGYSTRRLLRPLHQAAALVGKVASRDLTCRMEVQSKDEIGRIGSALNAMVVDLNANLNQVTEHSRALASASHELYEVASGLKADSGSTLNQSQHVSASAEHVSQHVSNVAGSVEQVNHSTQKIAQQTSEAARATSQAADVARQTLTAMERLDQSSTQIGNVIKVINSIAEQTNLLALNATIEASRAGEAGKGFAVVANEVKELARQTAKATEEIRSCVQTIQSDASSGVTAIREITSITEQIEALQKDITCAVEGQAHTTREISTNVAEAANGSAEIAQNATDVSTVAQSTATGAEATETAAENLSRLAENLNSVVRQFTLISDAREETNGQHRQQANGKPAPSNRTNIPQFEAPARS